MACGKGYGQYCSISYLYITPYVYVGSDPVPITCTENGARSCSGTVQKPGVKFVAYASVGRQPDLQYSSFHDHFVFDCVSKESYKGRLR